MQIQAPNYFTQARTFATDALVVCTAGFILRSLVRSIALKLLYPTSIAAAVYLGIKFRAQLQPLACSAVQKTARLFSIVFTEARTFVVAALVACKEHSIAVAGVTTGFFLGALATIRNNHSLMASNFYDCLHNAFNGNWFLRSVNELREKYPLIGPILFSITVFGIENVVGQTGRVTSGIKSILSHAWQNLTVLVGPIAKTYLLLNGSWELRGLVSHRLLALGIDTSGHAIFAVCFTYLLIQCLTSTRGVFTATQQRFSRIAIALRALTDIPWTYNTIANCHSIADVASAVSLVALTGFIMKVSVLGANAAWNRIQRINRMITIPVGVAAVSCLAFQVLQWGQTKVI